MASVISRQGIDTAMAHLHIRQDSLKYRLLDTIQQHYAHLEDLNALTTIETNELVRLLWDTSDEQEIKKKRKHLSSLKWAINDELKRLYRNGQNPEGIIIGPHNTFVMCDEAKDNILTTFTNTIQGDGSLAVGQIAEALGMVQALLTNPETMQALGDRAASSQLEQLKTVVEGLAQKLEVPGPGPSDQPFNPASTTASSDAEAAADADIATDELLTDDAVAADRAESLDTTLLEPEDTGADLDASTEAIDQSTTDETIDACDADIPLEAADVDTPSDGFVDTDMPDISAMGHGEDTGDQTSSIGEVGSDHLETDHSSAQKARLLAERFERFLSARERFYNQYMLIPGGRYTVRSSAPQHDEKPEEQVTLAPYYIGGFPVTNALFEIFVQETGYQTTAERVGFGMVYSGRYKKTVDEKTGAVSLTLKRGTRYEKVYGACWHRPLGPLSNLHQKRHHPVVQVSLKDARAFAAWVGKRLPTEQEWEAAMRTDQAYMYPWGNVWQADTCNIEDSYIADTSPVDAYVHAANALGIADALGNVLEWTMDLCDLPPQATQHTRYHIVKGGSFLSNHHIRLCSRFTMPAESTCNILGFRCVAD